MVHDTHILAVDLATALDSSNWRCVVEHLPHASSWKSVVVTLALFPDFMSLTV